MKHEPADTIMAHAALALRVVDDPHDLAQLRVGAVVVDAEEAVLEKVNDGKVLGYVEWHSPGESTDYGDEDVDLPAVVLYEPGVGG